MTSYTACCRDLINAASAPTIRHGSARGRSHEQLATGEPQIFHVREMGGGSAGRIERLLPPMEEISKRSPAWATRIAPASANGMAGAAMQPAVHTQSMPEAGHGIPCSALLIPSSLMEDIDMLSSAGMLMAHCIIAVDATVWDTPPRKRAKARKVAKSRRDVFNFSMPGRVPTPLLAVKNSGPTRL